MNFESLESLYMRQLIIDWLEKVQTILGQLSIAYKMINSDDSFKFVSNPKF